MTSQDFPWVQRLILDMAYAFLDQIPEESIEDDDAFVAKLPFTVQYHSVKPGAVEFRIQPKDAATCARIVGHNGERIKAIDSFVEKVGRAWRVKLACFCDQPHG